MEYVTQELDRLLFQFRWVTHGRNEELDWIGIEEGKVR